MTLRTLVILVVLSTVVVGCGGTRSAGTGEATSPQVVLERSGGFAGVDDRVTVDADGAWSSSTRDLQREGRLTSDELAELRPLLASAANVQLAPTDEVVFDAFEYRLTLEGETLSFTDADTPEELLPLVQRLLELLP